MFRRFAVLFAAVMLSSCASLPGPEEAASDARNLFADYTAAFNGRQWDRVVAMFSDSGFQWSENGKVEYASKAAMAGYFDGLRANVVSASFRPSDTNVTAHGADAAQIATRYATTMATRDGRRQLQAGEMRLDVRREGRAWKIVNVDTRPTAVR
jgi:ketosteroid isomerase-like protein